MAWKASGSTSLPVVSDRDRKWDGSAAEDHIFKWAGGKDDFDQSKVQRAFFAYDDASPENVTSYKLPFADVVDGELKVVPNAVEAVAVVLEGGRGGVDLPKSVQDDVRKKVETYYKKLDKEVPW